MNGSSGKILLVEDNKETQLMIKILLRDAYSIDISNELERALNLLEENTYSLILLDINLSRKKEGMELLKHIKNSEDCKHIPVIIISAYDFSDDEKIFLKENSNEFISKPLERELLFDLVKRNTLRQ